MDLQVNNKEMILRYNGVDFPYEIKDGETRFNLTELCKNNGKDLEKIIDTDDAMGMGTSFLNKLTIPSQGGYRKICKIRHFAEFGLTEVRRPKRIGDPPSTWAGIEFTLYVASKCSYDLHATIFTEFVQMKQEKNKESFRSANQGYGNFLESDDPIDAIARALTKMLESYTLANKRAKIAAKASSKMIRGAKRSLVGMKEISDSVSSGGAEVKMLSDEIPKEIQTAPTTVDTIALAETPAIPKITEPEPDAPTSGTDTFGNILTQTHPGERQQLLDRVDGIIRKQGRAITMNVITNIFKLYGILTADDKGPTRKAIDKKIMFIDTRYNKGVRFEVYCICENYVDYFVKALVAYTEPGYRGPGFLMEVGFTKEIQDEMYQLEVEKIQRQQSKQMRLDL